MTATKLTLAAAVLTAGTLLLSGCEPANTAGSPGGSNGGDVTCDSKGWGPLSGCDGAGSSGHNSSSQEPTRADTPSCKAEVAGGELDEGGFSNTRDESEGTVTDPGGCVTGSHPEPEHEVQTEDQKNTEVTEHRFTVTVTWIVVNIDVTGFRECVISLKEAPPNPTERFSRRITTPEDCEAQQVDAVYRPVSE